MPANRQLRLVARPVGAIKESDFEVVEAPIPEPGDGEFLAEVTHISIVPAMRGWMNAGPSYAPPVELGQVMRATTIGRVVSSRHPEFAAGDYVHGRFGVQQYAIGDGAETYKVHPGAGRSLAAYLGVLGMTGLTAYFGLLDVGRLAADDVVLVSGAAGAVGTTVGQIAKVKGAHPLGIAGGPEKCRMLIEDLGFEAAIDYKSGDLREQLREHTPRDVDVFFDNVGGEILDLGLTRIGRGARVVICGAISQYNNAGPIVGPSNYLALLVARASMAGFVYFDYADKFPDAIAELTDWLTAGRLTSVEYTVRCGIESFPSTLNRLFAGEDTGKLVLEREP